MLDASFIAGEQGRLFCTVRAPSDLPCKAILTLPAFGDEMNKSRRMLAETGRLLAAAGIGLINVDLYGTGDSEGRFVDSDWEIWKRDLLHIAAWCEAREMPIYGLLGVRSGSLIAVEIAHRLATKIEATVLWQPVVRGESFVRSLLRVRSIASLTMGTRETVDDLMDRLIGGEAISVAGYTLDNRIVGSMLSADLTCASLASCGQIFGLEVSRVAHQGPVSRAPIGDSEWTVERMLGDMYWVANEPISVTSIVSRTVELFKECLLESES